MAPSSDPDVQQLPNWFRWLGAGLTGMLVILFGVLLQQVQQQARLLKTLQGRLQGLENARAVERTNALEEQVRATSERMQGLEGLRSSVTSLSQEQAQLRQELQRFSSRGPLLPELPTTPPPLPPVAPSME